MIDQVDLVYADQENFGGHRMNEWAKIREGSIGEMSGATYRRSEPERQLLQKLTPFPER